VVLAAHAGMLVLFDMHRIQSNVWPDPVGLWYRETPENSTDVNVPLMAAWSIVLRRFCSHWNVFGVDIFNEPWGAEWGSGGEGRDWRAAAEAIGGFVLTE
jgi:endoglucanase